MINTGCCELMEIFEITIGTTKKVMTNIDTSKDFDKFPTEAKEQYKDVWEKGAYYFSFLLADKLYKEDRLCKERCERIYQELEKEFNNLAFVYHSSPQSQS